MYFFNAAFLSLEQCMLFCVTFTKFALLFVFEVQRGVALSLGAVFPKIKQVQVLSKHLFLSIFLFLFKQKKADYLSKMTNRYNVINLHSI